MIFKWNSLFQKRKQPAIQTPSIFPNSASGSIPFPRGVTLELWRSSGLAVQAKELYRQELFGHILAVLHNSAPTGFMRGAEVSPVQAHIEFGRVQGYFDCLRLLEGLPDVLPKKEEIIESTFEPPFKEDDVPMPEPVE